MPFTTAEVAQMQALLDEYHTLAADVTEQHGAYFLRNDEAPTRHDGNHVRHIRRAEDLDALFAAVEVHYADRPYRMVRTDPLTPPAVEARLLLEGYDGGAEIVLAAVEPPRGRAGPFEVREVPADSDDLAALQRAADADAADEFLVLIRRRGAAFSWYLAYEGDTPVGHLSQRTRDGVGYLESLYVRPEFRMRGAATALVAHTDAAARAGSARFTFLPTWYADTPRHMYARMGFAPVFAFRNWVKELDA